MPESLLDKPEILKQFNGPEAVDEFLQIGSGIVDIVNAQANMLVQEGDEMAGDISGSDIERVSEKIIGQEVSSQQDFLALMVGEHQKSRFVQVIEELKPPEALKGFLGAESSADIVNRVLHDKTQPRAVANFFEWYRHALGEQRKQFDAEEKPVLIADFNRNLEAAVRDGIIPASLPERMRKLSTSDKLHVQLADHSLFMGNIGGGAMHFRDGKELIWLQVGSERGRTFHHEGLHGIEGMTEDPDGQPGLETDKTKRGMYRLFGDTAGGEVINEAVIEHTTDSILHGQVHITLPVDEAREHNLQHYLPNRFLLYFLCENGVKPIDPKLFINAAFENGTVEESPANQLLEQELNAAFPDLNVIERIKNMGGSDLKSVMSFMKGLTDDWEGLIAEKQAQAESPDASRVDPQEIVTPEQVIVRLLANNQGFFKQHTPPKPSVSNNVITGVDSELVALRESGQSEKKALRSLAKRYHSDTNKDPVAGEKIRVVTQRLEDFNRREGQKLNSPKAE